VASPQLLILHPPRAHIDEYAMKQEKSTVTVGWPPLFTHAIPPLVVDKDQPLLIDVSVTAMPSASFQWFIDDARVPDDQIQVHQPQANQLVLSNMRTLAHQ
jgi:hypothetical protein